MTARALLAGIIALLFPLLSFAAPPRTDDGNAPTATVLCYHIVEAPQDSRMEVSRETFRQHMRYLAMTGYNVIPLRHLQEFVTGKRTSIPPNAVVITIDDGWRSTYTEAYPELKKRKFPFTVFIYPKIIGQTYNAMTWKQIREMSDAGVDIQSHALSHPFLTKRRSSLDEASYSVWLQRELSESKRLLEKETGKPVTSIAYPYGDYDDRVAVATGRAGYTAALTCDFGRVKRGSDPLRMKRVVIDKRMDFAEFRRYMGAGNMLLAEITPMPGKATDPGISPTVISARIPNHNSIDPRSVGMALLSLTSAMPYTYDAKSGAITLVVNDAIRSLQGKYHRAVVWARDKKTGKRLEASWVFRLPDPAPPAPLVPPSIDPAEPASMQPGVQPAAAVAPADTAVPVAVPVIDPSIQNRAAGERRAAGGSHSLANTLAAPPLTRKAPKR